MSRLSQTMRIDIPPDLREELRLTDRKLGAIPKAELPPDLPAPSTSQSSLGDPDFQQLFQSVYDGAIISDLSGGIVDANNRALHFLQYTREHIITMNLTQIISGATPETIATLQTGIIKERFILIQAYCHRHDNTLFPCEIAVNCLNIRNKQYLCCFVRDISQRQRAEELLRTVHTAIQNSATGIAIANLKGRIDYINLAGAKLWNQSSTTPLIGMSLGTLIDDPELVDSMIYAVKGGNSWNAELTIKTRDHSTIHVQMAVAPNRDSDDNLIGMVISILDISDRIRANEAEQKADRQRVMMESLGAACHHLGQPATVLLASLELMARVRQTDKGMADELLSSSIDAAESLRTMLHSLNDITEYRTTSYIEGDGESGLSESRILDVSQT